MKLKNRYFILRHGETAYQTRKKNWTYPKQDSRAVKLTEKGIKQIKEAAQKLEKEKIDLIFASDFFRTQQTAKMVAREAGAKKTVLDKRLRDVSWGIYAGRIKEEAYNDFPRHSLKRFYQAPPEGESWEDCQKRMMNFLKDIDKKHKGKTILIVSHGDPLWLLEGTVNNYTPDELLDERKNNFIGVGELRKLYGV